MRKLKLNLDDLKVETFDTTPKEGEGREGTIIGFNAPTQPFCVYTESPTSCQDTCAYSCANTCVVDCTGQTVCYCTRPDMPC